MENVIDYSVEFLKVHPRNNEFYEDISGEDYEQFKATIQNEGVLTPLIVAPDMTVISGHQRLKASKDLGFTTVPIIIRQDIKTEEDKMAVLLATNYGRPDSAKKKRKIADEYVRLRGKGHGGNHEKARVDNRLSLKEIAKQLGVSETGLKEMLLIERKLTPELKEMLDAGMFTETTASKILVKLPREEQEKLITTYGKEIIEGVTQKQMQEYVNKIKALENANSLYEKQLDDTLKKADSMVDEKTEDLIQENAELEIKLRKQYEATQQTKKEYEELRALVSEYQRNIEYLKNEINEQKKVLNSKPCSDDIKNLYDVMSEFNQLLTEYVRNGRLHEILNYKDGSAIALELINNMKNVADSIQKVA